VRNPLGFRPDVSRFRDLAYKVTNRKTGGRWKSLCLRNQICSNANEGTYGVGVKGISNQLFAESASKDSRKLC
jgi:hypothetical protein